MQSKNAPSDLKHMSGEKPPQLKSSIDQLSKNMSQPHIRESSISGVIKKPPIPSLKRNRPNLDMYNPNTSSTNN